MNQVDGGDDTVVTTRWRRLRRAFRSLPRGTRFDLNEAEYHRRGRTVTLLEMVLWISGVSMALALPHWLGFSPLLAIFYGGVGALTWRLAKVCRFPWAILIAFGVSLIVTALMVAAGV